MSAAPPPVSLQRSDDIGSALLNFLVLDLHSQFFELAAQVLRDFLLFAGDADNISHVPGKLNNPLPIHLFKHLAVPSSLLSTSCKILFKGFC